jgi:hypothetical protein
MVRVEVGGKEAEAGAAVVALCTTPGKLVAGCGLQTVIYHRLVLAHGGRASHTRQSPMPDQALTGPSCLRLYRLLLLRGCLL